jgi:hypothetical protein
MTHIHASMESQIEQDKKIVMTRDFHSHVEIKNWVKGCQALDYIIVTEKKKVTLLLLGIWI